MSNKVWLFFLILAALHFGCGNEPKKVNNLEIVSDSWGFIQFQNNSLEFSTEGKKELDQLGMWLESNQKVKNIGLKLYEYRFSGDKEDQVFLGVKRSKLVIDYLFEKFSIPKNMFLIQILVLEESQENYDQIQFVIEHDKSDLENEDEYFEGSND
ncbi:MAG: hypothetical protein AAGF85_22205 [Bacteroidota bacterium]